jgi:hypothetical protein
MPETDPNHPYNLTKRSMEMQGQALSDSKYDPPIPKRFKGRESFKNPFQGPSDWVMAIGLLVFLIAVYFYSKDTMRGIYILILTTVVALLFMIYKKALLDHDP